MLKAQAHNALVAACLALVGAAVQAQDGHAAHGAAAAPAAHGAHSPAPAQVSGGADAHASHAPAGDAPMDHSSMRMQGGAAPADARDPHAYSNGFVRGGGDYAVPGVPQLRLADEHRFVSLRAQTLERRLARQGEHATAMELQGWYGNSYDRAVLKFEGELAHGKLQDSRTELLWGHAIDAYWDTQLGVRLDTGPGPGRQWLASGVQGLAPYWFELDATAYIGNGGRTALRVEASYELLLIQRLILEPRASMQFYGKNDEQTGTGRGLSEASIGLRLRYEINRQFAPYIGVERAGSMGRTGDYVRASGGQALQTRWMAGVRMWF